MADNYQTNNGATHGTRGKTNAYLVGGGIASLASAAYLLRDGHIRGRISTSLKNLIKRGKVWTRIVHLKQDISCVAGECLMRKQAYTCTYDVLSFIPSFSDPKQSVKEEMFAFNQTIKTHAN